MLVEFLFLCFLANSITCYEGNFCGYIEESEEVFRREFCSAQDDEGRRKDALPGTIPNRDIDSSSQPGVKGREAEPHMFKWMAFYDIEWPVSHQKERCGGVLISDAAVLTAAHCLQRNNETALVTSVTLGVHDVQNPGDNMLVIPVERTVVHEQFNKIGILDNDLGILYLREEIVWSENPQVRPICLPPRPPMRETYQYNKATVTGWGFRHAFLRIPSVLEQGDVTVYDIECAHIFPSMSFAHSLCTGSLHQTSGCRGDAGGPVIARRPNQTHYELIGISLGNCVDSTSRDGTIYFSLFTKITEFWILDWIHDKLKESLNPALIALNKLTTEKYVLEKTLRHNENMLAHIRAWSSQMERTLKSVNTGHVLLIGGYISSEGKTATVEIYGDCPVYNRWYIPEPTKGAAAAFTMGSVYFCGGETSSGYSTSKCYFKVGSQWIRGPSMVKERYRFTLNNVGGRLVAVGGKKADSANTVEVLDPVPHTWTLQNYTLDSPRRYHCALTMSDTTLMLVGGFYSITTQLLDIDTGSVTQYRDLPHCTAHEAPACGLYKERIILTGGYGRVITSEVFTLDPSDTGNPWVSAGGMVEARAYHTMAILNGVPTVYGGYGGSSDSRLDSIEEMQPDGTWKITERLSEARSIHASVTIPCQI